MRAMPAPYPREFRHDLVRGVCDEVEAFVCADGGGDVEAGDGVLEVGFGAAGQEDYGGGGDAVFRGEVDVVEDLPDGHADVVAGSGLLGLDDPALLGDVEV